MIRVGAPALLLGLAFAGCFGGTGPQVEEMESAIPWGVHPWPAGDEWPLDADAVFEVLGVDHVPLESFDGTTLDGWIVRPDVPDHVRVPVVLWSAPYFGQCSYFPPPPLQPVDDYPSCHYATGDDPALWDNDQISEAVPVRFLVNHGYAVAVYNVRGTGNSGGCFEWFGPNERRDQTELVEWLGAQPWSNGRVGMMGLSYHGTTPWEAAVQAPPSLKTIVVAGMISDPYLFSHTPQGATFTTIPLFNAQFALRVSLSPPIAGTPEHATAAHLPVAADRACADVARALTEDAVGTQSDVRDGAFWDARRLLDEFPRVTASVLLTHGFQDLYLSGHQLQEAFAWQALTNAPKRQLEGQWGHEFPNFNTPNPEWALDDWNDRLLEWLDFWLKGLGDAPPREGLVDYQDNTGAWHESAAWPPAGAATEVLYLGADGALSTAPGPGARTFRSVPEVEGPSTALCDDGSMYPGGGAPTGLAHVTGPLEERILIAGNPHAWLQVTSDQGAGLVAVHVYAVGVEIECDGGAPSDARRLAFGTADLRYHAGGYAGSDFPVGEVTGVRVDLTNLAEVVEAGERLAVVVSYGDPIERAGQTRNALVTVHSDGGAAASHIVLPLAAGSLGGEAPTIVYPGRPFSELVDT